MVQTFFRHLFKSLSLSSEKITAVLPLSSIFEICLQSIKSDIDLDFLRVTNSSPSSLIEPASLSLCTELFELSSKIKFCFISFLMLEISVSSFCTACFVASISVFESFFSPEPLSGKFEIFHKLFKFFNSRF